MLYLLLTCIMAAILCLGTASLIDDQPSLVHDMMQTPLTHFVEKTSGKHSVFGNGQGAISLLLEVVVALMPR